MRLLASRIGWIADNKSAINMPITKMTTNNWISVNAGRFAVYRDGTRHDGMRLSGSCRDIVGSEMFLGALESGNKHGGSQRFIG
jgi:hypothetical protein